MLSALDVITFLLRLSNLLNVPRFSALGGLPSRRVQWLLNTSFSLEVHGARFIAVGQIKWWGYFVIYFVLDFINGMQPIFYKNRSNKNSIGRKTKKLDR